MVLAVMDRFDSSERPVFDAAWQAFGRVNGLAARGGGDFIENPCREGWYFYARCGLQPIKRPG